MLRFLTILLSGLAALIVLVVVVGLFLPRTVHVERSVTIHASAEQIWPYLVSYHRFNEWSPWMDRDPDMTVEITGPESGVGTRMEWSGNDQVGTGAQEITAAEPYTRVETYLDFGSEGDAVAFFDLTPVENGTEVTWGFDTDFGWNIIGRYFGLMFDSFVGADYEEGLTNLRNVVEEQVSHPRDPDGNPMPLPGEEE